MANDISNMAGLLGSQQNSTLGPMGGSNQYMSYPMGGGMGGSSGITPDGGSGVVPTPPSMSAPPTNMPSNNGAPLNYIVGSPGSANEIPNTNSQHLSPTFDPGFTQQYYNMLGGQMGSGLPGFNLQTMLPSSGQSTGAGQLNAPLNSTDQMMQQFLAGGQTNMPGANQLTQMAQTGDPVNQTPAWQAMVASEQQNTAQNANNLREQYASGGDLNSSPFGSAMQQFYNQNTMNQNSQLTQATASAQENAANRKLGAEQGIQSEAGKFGAEMQTLDQNAIQNMLQEFNYTLPQNNPMNQMFQQAALSSPNIASTPTSAQNFSSILNSIGSLF